MIDFDEFEESYAKYLQELKYENGGLTPMVHEQHEELNSIAYQLFKLNETLEDLDATIKTTRFFK